MDQSTDAPERWLPVVGYEGFYEVSDLGRVRSLRRKTASGWRGGRVRRATPHPDGHLMVSLSVQNKVKTTFVHLLVVRAFIGPCPAGQEVRHLNGDPAHNHLSNLAYGTRSENNLDAVRHGTHWNGSKTYCKRGHEFTPENTVWLSGGRRRNCLQCKRRMAREVAQRKRTARLQSAA